MSARRAFVLVWAILQLALPGIAALADAVASRTSAHAVAHVEGSTKRDCVRVHEADCVFCQFLSAAAAPARCVGAPVVAAPLALSAAGSIDRPRGPPRDGTANPRAPPLV